MQQEDSNTQRAFTQSTEVQGINELDKRILKLQKMKSTRNAFIIIGITLLAFWVFGYVAASAATSANSASVALFGPILSSPLLVLAILLIILGVVGRGTANKHLYDAQNTRDILIKSLHSVE